MIQVAVGVAAPPIRMTRAAPCSIHSNATGPCTRASGSGRNEASDNSMSQGPARNCNVATAGLVAIASPVSSHPVTVTRSDRLTASTSSVDHPRGPAGGGRMGGRFGRVYSLLKYDKHRDPSYDHRWSGWSVRKRGAEGVSGLAGPPWEDHGMPSRRITVCLEVTPEQAVAFALD